MQINRLIIFLLFVLLPVGVWAEDSNTTISTIDNKANIILEGISTTPNQIIKVKIHNVKDISDLYYAFVMSDENAKFQLTKSDIDITRLKDGELVFDISTNEEEFSKTISSVNMYLDKGLKLKISSKSPYEYKSDNIVNLKESRDYMIVGETESNIKSLNISVKDSISRSINYTLKDIDINKDGSFAIKGIDLSKLKDGKLQFKAIGIDEAGNKTEYEEIVLKDTKVKKPVLLKRIKNNNLSNVVNRKILVASGNSEANAKIFFKFLQGDVVVKESVVANDEGKWELLGGDLDISVFENRTVHVEIYQEDVAGNRSAVFRYENKKFKRPIFPIVPIPIDAVKYQLVHTISGNSDEIKDIKITKKNIYIATYGMIKVYGKAYAKLKRKVSVGGDVWVNSLALSKDKVFAALSNGNIKIYSKSLRLLKTIQIDSLPVLKIKLYKDKLVSSSASGNIKIIDIKSYKVQSILKEHQWDVGAICISKDKLYSGSDDYSIKIWDLKTLKLERSIKAAHSGTINDIIVFKGKLISASDDKTIIIRDARTGRFIRKLDKHKNPVNKLDITNGFLISVSSDRKMIMWDIDTGEVLKRIKAHSKKIAALAVNDYNIVTGSRDYKIKIWGYDDSVEALDSDDETSKPKYALVKSFKVKQGTPTALTENENDIIVTTDKGYIYFYNKITYDYVKRYSTADKIQKPRNRKKSEEDDTEAVVFELKPKLQKIYDVECLANKLLCSLEDTSVKIWDMEKNKAISLLRGDTTIVKDIKISPVYILTASKKGSVGVYDIESGDFVNLIEGHQYDVDSIALYEDDKVVSAGDDYSIKIRDIESGDLILNIKDAHEDVITKLLVFGNMLISASLDGTIKVRDIRDGSLLAVLSSHKAGVTSLALDEDGMTLISTSEDKTLKAWSLRDFSLIATMDKHKGGVVDILITDDYLVSIAKDKTIKVWKYYE